MYGDGNIEGRMHDSANTFAVGVPRLACDGIVIGLCIELDLVRIWEDPLGEDRFDGLAELEEHRGFRTDGKRVALAFRRRSFDLR